MNVNVGSGRTPQQASELVIQEEHIDIENLKLKDAVKRQNIYEKYLNSERRIPKYPTPVQFKITQVAHVTTEQGFQGIIKSKGFKGCDKDSFSWWRLKITEAEIAAAEDEYLRSINKTAALQPFLSRFTTSPLFREKSRFGTRMFTFPVTELIEAYKMQKCGGEEPVLRVYGTKLFKQEIEYVVLVHSPQFNEKYKRFPKLESSELVAYDGNQIIWKAQAICDKLTWKMAIDGGTVVAENIPSHVFYVWDQVSLAFHVGEVLTFPEKKLIDNCTACELDLEVDIAKLREQGRLNAKQ